MVKGSAELLGVNRIIQEKHDPVFLSSSTFCASQSARSRSWKFRILKMMVHRGHPVGPVQAAFGGLLLRRNVGKTLSGEGECREESL